MVAILISMIRANELRIGNIVYAQENQTLPKDVRNNYPKGNIEVEDIIQHDGINMCRCDCAAYRFEDIEPIPLTPELLVKCGFYRTIDKVKYPNSIDELRLPIVTDEFKKYTFKSMSLIFSHSGDFGFNYIHDINDGNTVDDDTYLPNIKYMHQLQNLYFALTGEELKCEIAGLA